MSLITNEQVKVSYPVTETIEVTRLTSSQDIVEIIANESPVINEEESPKCTASLDLDPIGYSSASSSDETGDQTEDAQPQSSGHAMQTRLKDGIVKPNPRYAFLSHKAAYPEPKIVTQALKHPGWNNAMGEEISNCKETNTWSLVPYIEDMNVLGSKWVFRTKLNADGMLDKLRARLVAQGIDQEEGIDYLETYSPVVRSATIRLILHTATVMNWEVKQMDVKNAFLHDDMAITGNDSEAMKNLLKELNNKFKMKDLGQFKYFLGIQAQWHSEGLFLSQQRYAEALIIAASMSNCEPMPTPLPLQIYKDPPEEGEEEEELFENPTYFRSLAGKLQYLTLTRPDIQFAVNFVCQKMHKPTVTDFQMLK
ncbi:putative mitochondrial protein [Cardamine amara subsp. amara]|uniref:Mitochondrial protein n=1 Tax=Cardamine amara subsp. amara TaxID=228776 RepID=A0ABD1BLH1_CARAN